jgi:hypothetical protein
MSGQRRFRAANACAIRASGLAQIGQFWRLQLCVAIACSWQREEQSVRQRFYRRYWPLPGDIRLPGRLVGGSRLRAGWDDRGV